jgi:alcohol dehydrogenase
VNRGNAAAGENVLVIGAGPIGLSVIEFARLAGARMIVMDLSEARLRFVRERMGIQNVIRVGNGQELDSIRRLTAGELPALVIDATGSNQSMSNALNYCAFSGRLVFVGLTAAEVSFPHAPVMHRRELTILASRNAVPADFTRIIKLIEEGQIDTKPWISHEADFQDLIEAFPSWTRPETGVIKAMVRVD